MTLFSLKCVAIVTMLIDHIGFLLFPEYDVLRIIGRIAFPIFAWGIANGYRHTSNVKKYVYRLLMLAVVSQVPYSLIYGTLFGMPWRMNIFVTLAMGLLTIMLYERFRVDTVLQYTSVIVMFVLSLLIPMDYGIYGLGMIFLFHLTYGRVDAMLLWQGVWVYTMIEVSYFFTRFLPYGVLRYLALPSIMQYGTLVAFLLIGMYSYKKGYAEHVWWFYWFYPVHLVILFCLYLFG